MNDILEFNNIYNMKCEEGMKKITENSVDLIIADPPFAIDYKANRGNYNRKVSNVIDTYNEVETRDYSDFTSEWMKEAYRILKPSGSIFVFSGWNNLSKILIEAEKLSLIQYNHIIWQYQFGVYCKNKFITSHYHVPVFCKNEKSKKHFECARFGKTERDDNGNKKYYKDREDVWNIKREYWPKELKTATKLPKEVIEKIVLYASEKGDLVVDPFSGSGQVAWVCKHVHPRRFISFEVETPSYEFSKKRLDTGQYLIKE